MYCSLQEAFQSPIPEVKPEKERRRRKRLPPPEPSVIEPDRPAHRPLPPAELLGGQPTENRESDSISELLNAFETSDYFPHPNMDSKNEKAYMLEPDWTTPFNGNSIPSWIQDRMASKDAEVPLTPAPWLDGSPTLWQKVAYPSATDPMLRQAEVISSDRVDDLQRKIDSMFSKLNDIETTRSESNHMEILMFILGGVFLVFLLDLLVKQGTKATVMLAAATTGGARSLANLGLTIY